LTKTRIKIRENILNWEFRRLAQQVDEGDGKSLEYNLPLMTKKERMFVHELSDYYNIKNWDSNFENFEHFLRIF